MSIASYPWNSAAEIRAHYAKRREECQARFERESTKINRDEHAELAEFRKLMAIVRANDRRDMEPAQ